MERVWKFRLSYTIDSDAELGKLGGLSRSTVAEYLRLLRAAGLIASVTVRGRRRIYPVDKEGNPTIPPEFAAKARPTSRAPAPPQPGAPGAPPNTGNPARVVFVQRVRQKNESRKPAERQRQQAITEASRETVLAAEQPQDVAPRPAATEQEQLLEALTADERATLEALPLAKRARLIRDSLCPFSPTSVAYLKKELVAQGRSQVSIPETTSTADVIRQLPGCKDGSLPKVATQRLANELRDQKYWPGFDLLLTAVWRGVVNAEAVALSLEWVTSKPSIREKSRYFWTMVQDRAGIKGRDLKRLATGGT